MAGTADKSGCLLINLHSPGLVMHQGSCVWRARGQGPIRVLIRVCDTQSQASPLAAVFGLAAGLAPGYLACMAGVLPDWCLLHTCLHCDMHTCICGLSIPSDMHKGHMLQLDRNFYGLEMLAR